MNRPPSFPAHALVVWLAIVADITALLLLWTSSTQLWLKIAVSALLIVGTWTIVVFHVTRRWVWKQLRTGAEDPRPAGTFSADDA